MYGFSELIVSDGSEAEYRYGLVVKKETMTRTMELASLIYLGFSISRFLLLLIAVAGRRRQFLWIVPRSLSELIYLNRDSLTSE